MFTQYSFDSNGNEHDFYSGKNCMKNSCKDLREHVVKITNFERLNMLPLTFKKDQILS